MCSIKLAVLFQCRYPNLYRSFFCRNFSLFKYDTTKCDRVLQPVIYFSRSFHDFEVNPSVQNKYRKLDNVSDDYDIIYRAPLMNYIKAAHYGSMFTAISTPICTLVYLFYNGPFIFPVDLGKLPLMRNYYELAAFYGGLYLIISQLMILIHRYPVRLYRNENNYIAIYREILPWIATKEYFKAGEIHRVSSFMPWGDCLFQLKSRKAILLEEHFLRPIDLYQMLGEKNRDKVESNKDNID